jgi:hypothetical protein
MKLVEFIERYQTAITRAVLQTYPPIYDAEARRRCGFDLRRLLRRPLGAQGDAIRAVALSLQRNSGTNVVGEMGVGKSMLAAAAAYLAGFRRVLILCPPHLVKKWRREVVQTVPGAGVAIVRTTADIERIRHLGGTIQFVVCSREQAKLGYRWTPAVVTRLVPDRSGGGVRDDRGSPIRRLCCPDCFEPVTDDEGTPLARSDLQEKKRRCGACGGPLWQADRTGPRRYPLADYVRRRMPGYFDLLVTDEMHEYKARGSAQGLAAAGLAEASCKTLTLTGTVFGGYSSTLFYLLWRFSPAVRAEFGYREEAKWISRYGIVERITKRDPDAYLDDGRRSKRRSYLTRTVEKPGVSPAVLFHLIGNTVFLRLADVAKDLPPYTERVALFPLDRGEGPQVPSQSACYHRLHRDLSRAVTSALHEGSRRLLATYLQALLSYPDACTRSETVLDPRTGEVLAHAPALSEDQLYPKELALVDLVRRNRDRGRRVLVYITHTESRDISPRLRKILEREGFRVAVLKASTVAADRREEWVAARVREGADVLICHPRLVQTGLDLVDWPSIAWYETEYSVYVMRQASRRSWRIGQRQPVEVTFFVYEGTLQTEALALVAAKMRSALMVEGELPEDGLAAMEGDGQDVFLALARRLTNQAPSDWQSLEALFAESRKAEAEAEGFLAEGDWQPEPERVDHPLPAGEVPLVDADLWTQVLTGGPETQCCPTQEPTRIERAHMVSFEELALLVRRPKARRKAAPEGQLVLFEQ